MKRIYEVLGTIAVDVAFFAIAAFLADLFANWFNLAPKPAIALGLIAAPFVIWIITTVALVTVTRIHVAIDDWRASR